MKSALVTSSALVMIIALVAWKTPAAPAPSATPAPAAAPSATPAPSGPEAAPFQQTPASALSASIARGKAVYEQMCLSCHMADGSGVPSMNPPLIKTQFVLGPKAALIKVVVGGMTGVEVDGNDYHNTMPPHPDFTDQQTADVLTYVRHSFGNKASQVTVADVKAAKGKSAAK